MVTLKNKQAVLLGQTINPINSITAPIPMTASITIARGGKISNNHLTIQKLSHFGNFCFCGDLFLGSKFENDCHGLFNLV